MILIYKVLDNIKLENFIQLQTDIKLHTTVLFIGTCSLNLENLQLSNFINNFSELRESVRKPEKF